MARPRSDEPTQRLQAYSGKSGVAGRMAKTSAREGAELLRRILDHRRDV